MKKLRLLLFSECQKTCAGCCNKDWDLNSLPVCTDYSGYDQIMLTGGEPMLHPDMVLAVIKEIRETSRAKIYVYTAKVDDLASTLSVIKASDGICLTLHDQEDVEPFHVLDFYLDVIEDIGLYSMRLNVFKGINPNRVSGWWKVKSNIEWIKNCPLPVDEVFMRHAKL